MFDRKEWKPCVGELVRIRQWEDMASEFGLSPEGNIMCRFYFGRIMKYLCGTEFEITSIRESGNVGGHNTVYNISVDMIEPVAVFEYKQEEFHSEEAEDFLKTFSVLRR